MRKESLNSVYEQIVLRGGRDCLNTEPYHDSMMFAMKILGRSNLFRDFVRREFGFVGEKLTIEKLGVELPVLGLAAGLAKGFEPIPVIAQMGMAGVMVGSYTANEWGGNPLKRMAKYNGQELVIGRIARFPSDKTIINRIGLPNRGVEAGYSGLSLTRKVISDIDLDVSITVHPNGHLSTDQREYDLKIALTTLYSAKPNKIELNVSCPNGHDTTETRAIKLQETCHFIRYFSEVRDGIIQCDPNLPNIPLFVKLSPDMTDEELMVLVKVIKESGYSGIVATNSTVDRNDNRSIYAGINGGQTGGHLFDLSLRTVLKVSQIDKRLGGDPLIIVGCGGIDSLDKLYQMKRAGADVFQILTGFIFNPWIFQELDREIRKEENQWLRK